ncbi:MAG TPA: alpha/beta hydrolase [Sphingomicrobium sp.]|nr:alpha/beta hydrolase [Sphingomicrobium sp.]
MAELAHLDVGGRRIAYRLREGASPTLVFLPGYASDMEGTKALALDAFAERRRLAMLRFDYSGTGSSGGRFEEGTLALWLNEGVALIDQLTEGPLILVGSSMGGWIALHVALLRPERVRALVGIAAAPDFTEWGFADAQSAERQGLARDFWESGRQLQLLQAEIGIDCPVRLIHGDKDEEVPLEVALRTMRALRSADVQLNVIKGGAHRLSEPHEIDVILRTVAALVEPAP